MEITYQLIEDDYRHGLLAWQTRSALRRWSYRSNFVVMAAIFVGSIIVLVWIPDLRYLSWFSLPLVLLWLIAVFVSPRLQARMQFRRMPSAQGPTSLTVSEAGIHVRSQHYDSHAAWQTYIGWAEGASVFILLPQPRIYIPIPKRAFTNEQLSEFREILRRNVLPPKKQG
jgi:hypothetical protein